MITGPIIAEIAALVGDPARATMVSALLDGRALTASELAFAARITPQTASTHLTKLTEAGLLAVVRDGRHRYFRLASPTVVDMIDGIVAVALQKRPRYRPLSGQARALSAARRHFCRLCLDWTERRPHIAGAIGAVMTKRYFDLGWMERMKRSHAVIVTPLGRWGFLETFGIDASALGDLRKHESRC